MDHHNIHSGDAHDQQEHDFVRESHLPIGYFDEPRLGFPEKIGIVIAGALVIWALVSLYRLVVGG